MRFSYPRHRGLGGNSIGGRPVVLELSEATVVWDSGSIGSEIRNTDTRWLVVARSRSSDDNQPPREESMHLQFREYRPADRDACISVFWTNVPRFFRDHELNDYRQFLDASACRYFVVASGTDIVGCGGFGIRAGSDTADLCWGMVNASRHRRRIGEYLLFLRLQKIVRETHAKSVRLGTSQLTDGFFRRFGFSTQSQTPGGLAEGLDDVQMHMKLTDDIRDFIERRWKAISG